VPKQASRSVRRIRLWCPSTSLRCLRSILLQSPWACAGSFEARAWKDRFTRRNFSRGLGGPAAPPSPPPHRSRATQRRRLEAVSGKDGDRAAKPGTVVRTSAPGMAENPLDEGLPGTGQRSHCRLERIG